MTPVGVPYLALSLAVAGVALALMLRGGARNGLLVLGAFFVVFAYGPLVNIALGNEYYSGINVTSLTIPALSFALAAAAVAVVHFILPQQLDLQVPPAPKKDYILLPWIYLSTISIGLVGLIRLGTIQADKLGAIASIGPVHYPYLLLQILVVSTFFLCRTDLARRLWWVNLVVYILYGFATSERDFLFVVASILVHRELLLQKERSVRAALIAMAAVALATTLATSRAAVGSTSTVVNVLNQGSILFIDSHLSRWVPSLFPFERGGTFTDAILRPLRLTDATPLAEWFVSVYSPGNPSGFGFSLSGEAYLNFGLVGVPVVFALLALAQRWLMNGSGSSDPRCYLSVVFFAAALYALRGDAAQIISTMLYASIFIGIVLAVRLDASRLRPTVSRRLRVRGR